MYSRIIPSRMDRRGSARRTAFNGNFASLFPGAYQVVQSDLGLTYGGAMLANAGNTSTATMGLTGALATSPVPIWIRLTGIGVTGDIYYDGLGVTPAMSGVSVVAATPIALTGSATGLSITPVAGTQVVGDTWKATCAALADQSGNGKNAIQAGAAQRPLVSAGPNGIVCVTGDGVDDVLTTAALNLPAPGTTPYYVFMVARFLATGATQVILGNSDFTTANRVFPPSGVSMRQTNSVAVDVACSPLAWNIFEIKRSNNAADTFKVGATTANGSAGNDATTNGAILSSPGSGPANADVLAVAYTPNQPNWSAVRAAVLSKYITVNV